MSGSTRRGFVEIAATGTSTHVDRPIAIEAPCAVELNGIAYAVMMVTPTDLDDFATGFCLAERLIDTADQILSIAAHAHAAGPATGIVLRVATVAAVRDRAFDRVRHRIADSSCGLCGLESLDQALRPLPPVPARAAPVAPAAIFAALAAMREHQPLNRATGAVHAALACAPDGTIRHAREDVGRHNAFDKLIGAMARSGEPWGEGFALLSSRCSYELVEKAALAGCTTLVTVSAATSLALDRAEQAGLTLLTLARSDSMLSAG